MKDLSVSFSSLEKQVDRLIARQQAQASTIDSLQEQLASKDEQLSGLESELNRIEEANKVLKLASAMQGSDENRTEAKRRINELVREIDKCISMMSK